MSIPTTAAIAIARPTSETAELTTVVVLARGISFTDCRPQAVTERRTPTPGNPHPCRSATTEMKLGSWDATNTRHESVGFPARQSHRPEKWARSSDRGRDG